MIPVDLPQALHSPGSPEALTLIAAVLVVGALAGEAIARTTRWPRLVGYTLAGWIAVATGDGVGMPLAGAVRLIIDLALALLLFEIGSRVRLRWLRSNAGLLATSVLESALAGVAVFLALRALDQPPAVALACAVLSVPASAAVAGGVALELGADGQVTQRMTVLTALNTMFGVLALIVFKAALEADRTSVLATVLALIVSVGTSTILAAMLATAVSRVARGMDIRSESAVLLVLGLVLLAVSAARWLAASTLLVPLLAGLLLRNASDRPWVWPRHFGTAGGVLVLLLFVVVGASWSPAALATGGVAAVVLLVARALGKATAVVLLSRWSRLSVRQGAALAVTLTPLSATALVMLSEITRALPELAATVAPIILSAVAVLELLGPIAVQLALRHAGELPTATAERKETR